MMVKDSFIFCSQEEIPSLSEYPCEEARDGPQICSEFLSELADGETRRLGINFQGGNLVLETIMDVFDGRD